MHPPLFRATQLLSDWPECRLELRCPQCRSSTFYPLRMLRGQWGDQSFVALLPRLKCKACKIPPAPVYLLAGHNREHCYGAPPDWAVELVPPPR